MSKLVQIISAYKKFKTPEGDSVTALDDVSLEVNAKEFITLLGPSGCGKTTLLRSISGFEELDSGEIIIDSQAMRNVPSYKRPVNTVFQNYALFPHINVENNIGYGLDVTGCLKKERNRRVKETLQLVGLSGYENRKPIQLSGGEQQRVALARCLINDTDLILMDEPLGALDALTREKMQSLVLKIWKETGKTIILITHSVEEALLLGERLYVMAPRPGRIHKEYNLPFATMGLTGDLREIKNKKDFVSKREEILSMIWNMEEEIMGREI